jgi:hypothetical protein
LKSSSMMFHSWPFYLISFTISPFSSLRSLKTPSQWLGKVYLLSFIKISSVNYLASLHLYPNICIFFFSAMNWVSHRNFFVNNLVSWFCSVIIIGVIRKTNS